MHIPSKAPSFSPFTFIDDIELSAPPPSPNPDWVTKFDEAAELKSTNILSLTPANSSASTVSSSLHSLSYHKDGPFVPSWEHPAGLTPNSIIAVAPAPPPASRVSLISYQLCDHETVTRLSPTQSSTSASPIPSLHREVTVVAPVSHHVVKLQPAISSVRTLTTSTISHRRATSAPPPHPGKSFVQALAQPGRNQHPTPRALFHSSTHRSRNFLTSRVPPPTPIKIKNEPQLLRLMALAQNPINVTEYNAVKAFCSQAHHTPAELRTPLHRVVLTRWRNPTVVRGGRDIGLNNPTIQDSVDDWYHYLCSHQASWPRGIRWGKDGLPIKQDIELRLLVSRLRPEAKNRGAEKEADGRELAQHNSFYTSVFDLFADDGLYRQIVEKYRPTIPRLPSPSPTIPFSDTVVTAEAIALHFARAGVSVDFAEKTLGPWARATKASDEERKKEFAVVPSTSENRDDDDDDDEVVLQLSSLKI